jgi:hypothetical protein
LAARLNYGDRVFLVTGIPLGLEDGHKRINETGMAWWANPYSEAQFKTMK